MEDVEWDLRMVKRNSTIERFVSHVELAQNLDILEM
jgi:hypothetical protein